MKGKYGPSGGALMLFRTYPRIPFWEQIHESQPFYTDTGRLHAYTDVPEAIEYGENFIVHREGVEATPYLQNVIVSSNPYIRPNDYGIPRNEEHWDKRTIRNIKMPWSEVKKTSNFLWDRGFKFYCLTPKTRHRVHSMWSNVDWHQIWDSNFGDPYRMDKRAPGAGEQQIHLNPQAAKDLGINDGDYVYVDANPADRPYVGAKPDDPFYKVARLMLRVKYNPAYPYNIVMMKHGTYIATEKSVKAHETRPDKRALSEGGCTNPTIAMGRNKVSPVIGICLCIRPIPSFIKPRCLCHLFWGEADNHAVNTVPKETLVRITKAEDGGINGVGIWKPGTTGYTPSNENEAMKKYIEGSFNGGGKTEDFWS